MEDIIKQEDQEIKPKKISKKVIILAVVCVVVIAAIIAGIIFIPKIFIKKEWACVDGKWVRQFTPELPQKPTPMPSTPCAGGEAILSTGEPINPVENPARATALDQKLGYGCGGPGSFKPELSSEATSVWQIPKDGSETTVSLGKYKIMLPERVTIDVLKAWIYFTSDKLGRADDKWYGLESSYVSGMVLSVNGYKKEIKLGGDEFMFLELNDYPLGDFYPYLKERYVEFEILLKLKCKNIQNGQCIGNNGKPLDYVNNADIKTNIRLFANGCEPFVSDLSTSAKIKY